MLTNPLKTCSFPNDGGMQVRLLGGEAKPMPGKRVQLDDETWTALRLLASDSLRDFQELADEAFGDLLAKHGRPVGLKAQLKRSAKDLGGAAPKPRSRKGVT